MTDRHSKKFRTEENKVLNDLFEFFLKHADFPPAEDFEMEHEAALRLEVFVQLQREGRIKVMYNSQYAFHLRLYIDSKFWKQDKATIDLIWPRLQQLRRDGRDILQNAIALGLDTEGPSTLAVSRALVILNRLGLITGQPIPPQFVQFSQFYVRKEILSYENIQDMITRGIKGGHYDLTLETPAANPLNVQNGLGPAAPSKFKKKLSLGRWASIATIAGLAVAVVALVIQWRQPSGLGNAASVSSGAMATVYQAQGNILINPPPAIPRSVGESPALIRQQRDVLAIQRAIEDGQRGIKEGQAIFQARFDEANTDMLKKNLVGSSIAQAGFQRAVKEGQDKIDESVTAAKRKIEDALVDHKLKMDDMGKVKWLIESGKAYQEFRIRAENAKASMTETVRAFTLNKKS